MWFLKWLTSGPLDRILSTVDRKLETDVDKDRIKADIIAQHYQSRAGFMQAGGFILMLLFAVPLSFWFAAVCVYSVFWCADCAFPKSWTIAALPAPIDGWAGLMITAIFGVVGFTNFKRR